MTAERALLTIVLLALAGPACSEQDRIPPETGPVDAAGAEPDVGPFDAAADPADNGAEPDAQRPALVGSNTNACLARIGALRPLCPTEDAVALPTAECCEAFAGFQADGCGCSPFVDALFGENPAGASRLSLLVDGLQAICPALGVDPPALDCADPVAPSGISSGISRTYNGGACPASDAEIDGLRFRTLTAFTGLFASAADEAVCFDKAAVIDALAELAVPEVKVQVPYGIGTYLGYEDSAEYLGISFRGLNHGFWRPRFVEVDVEAQAMLEVSEGGDTWLTGSTSPGAFFDDAIAYDAAFLVQRFEFEGCETRLSTMEVVANDSLRDFVERYVQAATLFDRWGARDVCRYHTLFCADDPETRQYETEQACLDFIGGLPSYSDTCGINRPMAGLSLPCKFKHHFMIPTNPALHCPHIGPPGTHDPDHTLKCDDDTECSDPDEGIDWPPVERIGGATPAEVLEAAAASNVGAEAEEPGCAVPPGG